MGNIVRTAEREIDFIEIFGNCDVSPKIDFSFWGTNMFRARSYGDVENMSALLHSNFFFGFFKNVVN